MNPRRDGQYRKAFAEKTQITDLFRNGPEWHILSCKLQVTIRIPVTVGSKMPSKTRVREQPCIKMYAFDAQNLRNRWGFAI